MTRAAHDIRLVKRAQLLRFRKLSYADIASALYQEFDICVSIWTIRDWVKYHSRGA